MSAAEIASVGSQALEAVRFGDVVAAATLVKRLESDATPTAHAWVEAVRAFSWHAAPSAGALPSDPSEPANEHALEPWALARLSAARGALLAMDLAKANAWLDAVRPTLASLSEPTRARFAIEAAYLGALRGSAALISSTPDPDGTIDRAVVRALSMAGVDSMSEAITLARRASRMARTEGAPQREYFANLVLARLRRVSGHPHLSTRISSAISRVAPMQWQGWLAWELAVAGSLDLARTTEPGSTIARLARHLVALLDGLRRGARDELDDSLARLRAESSGIQIVEEDIETLAAVLDPSRPRSSLPDDVDAWAYGAAPLPPRGLYNFRADGEDDPTTYVLGLPDRAARRVLGVSLALTSVEAPHVHSARGRIQGLVAALLLAGPEGLDERSLFETVYGFGFKPATHTGALRVALHRARKKIAGVEIDRSGDRLVARATAPLAVTDPRSSRSVHDGVLHLVAQRRAASAKEIASLLAIPLRNAQRALATLAADGWCSRVGKGPASAYVVEDTTFSEPTRSNVWKPVRR